VFLVWAIGILGAIRWFAGGASGKTKKLIEKLAAYQVDVVDFGLVDDAGSAYALVPKMKAANLDLIFATWSPMPHQPLSVRLFAISMCQL
jgi:hypothetical protein